VIPFTSSDVKNVVSDERHVVLLWKMCWYISTMGIVELDKERER